MPTSTKNPTSGEFAPAVTFLDADSVYFKICYKTKKKHEIRSLLKHKLERIKRLTSADELFIAVKGKGNYRNDLYPHYKSNRKDLEPDMREALNYAHSIIVEKHGAVMADGMEADDLVSIWAHEARDRAIEYTIAGIDKDLLQIPGKHFNFDKEEFQYVDDDTAHLKLMLQCITGDSTDNIPGVKGIGPKKAEKILANVPAEDRWKRVVAAWPSGDPSLSYKLLRMLTSWEDYEEIRNEIDGRESSTGESTGETVECEQDVPESGTSREVQDEGLQSVSEVSKGEVVHDSVAVQRESAS